MERIFDSRPQRQAVSDEAFAEIRFRCNSVWSFSGAVQTYLRCLKLWWGNEVKSQTRWVVATRNQRNGFTKDPPLEIFLNLVMGGRKIILQLFTRAARQEIESGRASSLNVMSYRAMDLRFSCWKDPRFPSFLPLCEDDITDLMTYFCNISWLLEGPHQAILKQQNPELLEWTIDLALRNLRLQADDCDITKDEWRYQYLNSRKLQTFGMGMKLITSGESTTKANSTALKRKASHTSLSEFSPPAKKKPVKSICFGKPDSSLRLSPVMVTLPPAQSQPNIANRTSSTVPGQAPVVRSVEEEQVPTLRKQSPGSVTTAPVVRLPPKVSIQPNKNTTSAKHSAAVAATVPAADSSASTTKSISFRENYYGQSGIPAKKDASSRGISGMLTITPSATISIPKVQQSAVVASPNKSSDRIECSKDGFQKPDKENQGPQWQKAHQTLSPQWRQSPQQLGSQWQPKPQHPGLQWSQNSQPFASSQTCSLPSPFLANMQFVQTCGFLPPHFNPFCNFGWPFPLSGQMSPVEQVVRGIRTVPRSMPSAYCLSSRDPEIFQGSSRCATTSEELQKSIGSDNAGTAQKENPGAENKQQPDGQSNPIDALLNALG